MIILGIDSATIAGFAIVDGERLIHHGTVDARDPMRVHQVVGDLVTRFRPGRAVIEQAYVARGKQSNPEVTMLLSRFIGRWEMALALRSVPTELVAAQAWQSEILAGLLPPRPKRDDRKAAAARWVKLTYRVDVAGDAADAIGLATYASRRATLDARLRRAG